MRGFSTSFICFVLCGLLLSSPSRLHAQGRESEPSNSAEPAPLPEEFRASENVPADVTLYLHIEAAGSIRRELAGRPIAGWFNEAFTRGEAGRVWAQVAERAGLDSAALFDAVIGRRATFVRRVKDNEKAEATVEWALITEVTPEVAEKALAALAPIALGPRSRMALLELPEHELLLARRGNLLLIGPKGDDRLFRQVLRSMAGRRGGEMETLADALREAKVSEGVLAAPEAANDPKDEQSLRASLYLRHDRPLGGWSVVIAELSNEKSGAAGDGRRMSDLAIRHHGSFKASPFSQALTRFEIDTSVLDAFHSDTMLAIVEPTDIGRSNVESFLHAMAGEGLLPRSARSTLAERRLIVLNMVDGIGEAETVTQPQPAVAVCYELKNSSGVQEDLDRQMLALAGRLNRIGGIEAGSCSPPPDFKKFSCGHPRSVELEGLSSLAGTLTSAKSSKGVAGDPPIAISLNWAIQSPIADGSATQWCAIASQPDHLNDILAAISRSGTTASVTSRPTDSLHSAGVMNGERLAQLLLSLHGSALRFTQDEHADREMREAMRLMADLAAALEQVRWQLKRPSANEIDLEVRIRLAR